MAGPSDTPEFMTTREVATLLRVKDRKVYELAANGQIPCRRVTGKLLFPRHDVAAWIGEDAPETPGRPLASSPPKVVGGSHDPLLDWALRAAGCGLATIFDGSLDGLERIVRGEAIACGLHVQEDKGTWNVAHVEDAVGGQPFVLIEWARRRRGLILAEEAGAVREIAELRGRRVAMRQPSSGGAILFDCLLVDAGLSLGDFEAIMPLARTEVEAAATVASGKADATLGIEAMARQFHLEFVPLLVERFDLLIDRGVYFEPPMQALFAYARSAEFATQASELGGYDLSGHGAVHWNGT